MSLPRGFCLPFCRPGGLMLRSMCQPCHRSRVGALLSCVVVLAIVSVWALQVDGGEREKAPGPGECKDHECRLLLPAALHCTPPLDPAASLPRGTEEGQVGPPASSLAQRPEGSNSSSSSSSTSPSPLRSTSVAAMAIMKGEARCAVACCEGRGVEWEVHWVQGIQ